MKKKLKEYLRLFLDYMLAGFGFTLGVLLCAVIMNNFI